MTSPLSYLLSLSSDAKNSRHRYLVRLVGSEEWRAELVASYLSVQKYKESFKLGGKAVVGANQLNYQQGTHLLGREVDCLIYDDIEGFDANSFTAASGVLRAGGLLFLSLSSKRSLSYRWLEKCLVNVITIHQNSMLPWSSIEKLDDKVEPNVLIEQDNAVKLITKVLTGHRKRPLVVTADRGRGKSSALGIASAQLINEKGARIIVTAPSRKATDLVFFHAERNLKVVSNISRNEILSNDSFVKFVSPDELLKQNFSCDLLLVDEASAIPVPMLQNLVTRYHRMVLSSTIHGYEGCGRGFTLKFFKWLDETRVGWKKYHIHQPVRWNVGDPLEAWVFDTFLLNTDLESEKFRFAELDNGFNLVSKDLLLNSPNLFKHCFALLVNAHYQTSPNDMLQILDDDSVNLFVHIEEGKIVGCIVAKSEGEFSTELLKEIMLGRRRPKGHLAPVILAGQLGVEKAALCRSLRVMRIVVSPDEQHKGIGSKMLSNLSAQTEIKFEYLSTSFGVTNTLYQFWIKNGYIPVRLGSKLDQASGTHSMLMLKGNKRFSWFDDCQLQFSQDFLELLPETFSELSASLVLELLRTTKPCFPPMSSQQIKLVHLYASGGSCYENTVSSLKHLLMTSISEGVIHPILISKLLQKKTWNEIVTLYLLDGRKHAEKVFREAVNSVLQFTV